MATTKDPSPCDPNGNGVFRPWAAGLEMEKVVTGIGHG